MKKRFLDVPHLKVWHLLFLVAVVAASLALSRLRNEAYDPHAFSVMQARSGGLKERRAAIDGLWESDLKRADLIPTLLSALHDDDQQIRAAAIRSLGNVLGRGIQEKYVDPRAEEAKARLVQLLHDPDLKISIEAAHALIMSEDRSQPLRDCLIALARGVPGEDSETREQAVRVLWVFRTDPEATALTVAAMSDPSPQIRGAVSYSLGRWADLKTVPDSVIEALFNGLEDEAAKVRGQSAVSLSKMGSRARSAVPAIIPMLDDANAELRLYAADALREFRLDAESALPALRGLAARETDPTVLNYARRAVKSIELNVQNFREQSLPLLTEDLNADDATRRRNAARDLGRYGPLARSAIPALRQHLSDADTGVRQAAEAALRQIEPADASSPSIP